MHTGPHIFLLLQKWDSCPSSAVEMDVEHSGKNAGAECPNLEAAGEGGQGQTPGSPSPRQASAILTPEAGVHFIKIWFPSRGAQNSTPYLQPQDLHLKVVGCPSSGDRILISPSPPSPGCGSPRAGRGWGVGAGPRAPPRCDETWLFNLAGSAPPMAEKRLS